MKRFAESLTRVLLAASVLAPLTPALAEEKKPEGPDRAAMIAAARELIGSQTFCALITLDESGRPQVRTMNPFPPEEDMTVYMATSTRSLKYRHIQRDARVTVYYSDHMKGNGYVALTGRAVLVDDPGEIKKRKRAYWDQAFDPGLANLVLIKVVPERLELVVYNKPGLEQDKSTWRPPTIDLGPTVKD
jgi:general stress protein 26